MADQTSPHDDTGRETAVMDRYNAQTDQESSNNRTGEAPVDETTGGSVAQNFSLVGPKKEKTSHGGAETVVQAFCLVVTIVGAGVGIDAVRYDTRVSRDERASQIFNFVVAVALCSGMLLNLGKKSPNVAAVLLGVVYYWFPAMFQACDYFSRQDGRGKSKQALAGAVLTCIGNGLASPFEITIFPRRKPSDEPQVEAFVIVIALAAFGCVIGVAVKLDDDQEYFQDIMESAVKSVIAIFLLMYAITRTEAATSLISVFLGSSSFCSTLSFGLKVAGAEHKDESIVYECMIITAVSVGIITAVALFKLLKIERERRSKATFRESDTKVMI